jgi:glutamate-1-semialdehyde 2,1-aminomutase
MQCIAPLGPVYQAGTLSGNPIAVSAGLATLARLDAALYERLESLGARLEQGLNEAVKASGVTACVQRVGSMITLFFHKGPVNSWADADGCNRKQFGVFFQGMLERGVYWPPAQFEAAFISGAHTEADIDRAIEAAKASLELVLQMKT